MHSINIKWPIRLTKTKLIRANSTLVLKNREYFLSKYPNLKGTDLGEDGKPDYTKMILRSKVYDLLDETPITRATLLSKKTNSTVFLKREDLSPVFSFKLRGAYNMIANLPQEEKSKGVIAYSAGNHAQGVAYASNKLGINATIVMPMGTPSIKSENVLRLGAKIVYYGDDFDDARKESTRLAIQHGYTTIPAFDHPLIIAGQGTIALELLRQIKSNSLSAIFIGIGGGGMLAGIGTYIKRFAPEVKIIGIETFDADGMYQSLQTGETITLEKVGSFADGTAIKMVGDETFRLCQEFGIDEIVHVNTDEISAAIKDIFEDTRTIVEPSGAMPVAGMKKYIANHPEIDHSDKTYVPVLSGANMNFDRLRFVSERAVLGEGKEVFLGVQIPNVPGTLKKLQSIIYPRSVTEFSYRVSSDSKITDTYLSFNVKDKETELKEVLTKLNEMGFKAYDLTNNEMAKTHGRYLIGGKNKARERIVHFEFPEKYGALNEFLELLSSEWNISLFHYRNHGDDIGKVLTGIDVEEHEDDKLRKFLDSMGYKYTDETENEVFELYIKD